MRLIPLVVVVFVLLWGAVAVRSQDVPTTLYLSSGSEITSLDPAVATDNVSYDAIENLFLGLTDLDPFTNEVMPELATHWDISEDGLIWTFYLRDDVMWRRYDLATGEAESIRRVVADDFVYSIKRACDPRLDSYYQTVMADVIAGCRTLLDVDVEAVTYDLIFGDTVQVFAPNPTTVEIHLVEPAAYFLSITTLPIMRPVPRGVDEFFGEDWTLPENIVTNGPYMLAENTVGVQRVFVRNDALPDELWHGGNIERVVVSKIEDGGTAFALYLDAELDRSGVPACEACGVYYYEPRVGHLIQQLEDVVFYFGFNMSEPPFDNVHVRRAFSAIIDRQAFVEQIRQGRGVPMIHLTPLGMVNSPPIDEFGIGLDADFAQREMVLAGYPSCEGFPTVEFKTYTGAGTWAEFWGAYAEEHLGCDPTLFDIEQIEFSELLDIIDDADRRPNAWTLGWGPDFPDAHSWVYSVLGCQNDNPFGRSCNAIDDLMREAAIETDPSVRNGLYQDIEVAFFGEEGEFPIAPIFARSGYIVVKDWFTGPHETDGIFGGEHWDAYSIDMGARGDQQRIVTDDGIGPTTATLSTRSSVFQVDPVLVDDQFSMTVVENLFLGLTDLDPVTGEVRPELATHWEVSDDGLRWTFHLRNDVYWMEYSSYAERGRKARLVTADDFVYAIKRACDPHLQPPEDNLIADLIVGCDAVANTRMADVTPELLYGDTIQVFAFDEFTLEIELQRPAAQFLSITTMPMMYTVPSEAIGGNQGRRMVQSNLLTNGPYFFHQILDDGTRIFVRNQDLPEDLWHGGNIDRVEVRVAMEQSAFELYGTNQVDTTTFPINNENAVADADPNEIFQRYDPVVFYYAFNAFAPPFDDVHVRRAFSAIMDREAFVEPFFVWDAFLPINHFSPVGLANGISDALLGVGFDPEYAREQMALSRYPNCEGFPPIVVYTYSDLDYWGQFFTTAAVEHLGCDAGLFQIEMASRDDYPIEEPTAHFEGEVTIENLPNVWTVGWGWDSPYPDPLKFHLEVLHCGIRDTYLGRDCTAVDSLIVAAARETDPAIRRQLFTDIELMFFGEDGEFPIVPLFQSGTRFLVKPWFTGPHETDGIFGGEHWDAYSIDMGPHKRSNRRFKRR